MKLFKDKYTLTLDEVSQMFETNDFSLLKRFKFIPDFLLLKHYQRFSLDFAEMFNQEMINSLFTDDIMRLKIINLVSNYLPVLYNGLLMTDHPYFREAYRERYGKDYEGLDDLKSIIAEMEKLGIRLKTISTPVDVMERKDSMKFEAVINYVELILEMPIPRAMKLYQFKEKYNAAIARAQEMAKLKDKKWQK